MKNCLGTLLTLSKAMLGKVGGFLVSLVVYFCVHATITLGLALAFTYYALKPVLRLLRPVFKLVASPFRHRPEQEPA